MQTFFRESSGSVIHPITISSSYSGSLAASAITWQDNEDSFLPVKIVNFGFDAVNLTISTTELEAGGSIGAFLLFNAASYPMLQIVCRVIPLLLIFFRLVKLNNSSYPRFNESAVVLISYVGIILIPPRLPCIFA